MNSDIEKFTKVLESQQQGIESTDDEELISGYVDERGLIKRKRKESTLEPGGGIKDTIINHFSRYSCGCIALGKENAGAKCDICGKTPCIKHSVRCRRCRKSICVRCFKEKTSMAFCNRCWWTLTFFRFLRKQYGI
jgi:hypothetical protein